MPIIENNNQIDLEFNHEHAGLQCGAGVQAREYHVDGHKHIPAQIALSDLDAHDLRGLSMCVNVMDMI